MRPSIFSVTAVLILIAATPATAAQLTVTLDANDYEVDYSNDDFDVIEMRGFSKISIPGKPMLPAKVFAIALPPGAEINSVDISSSSITELPGTYRIKPSPPIARCDNATHLVTGTINDWQQNYESTYSSDAVYPEQIGQYLGSGQLRKYSFARIAFFPFSYHPRSGKLLYHRSCRVTINYSISPRYTTHPKDLEQLLSDTVADERASRLFVNYSTAQNWYAPTRKNEPRQTHDYVIITDESLQDSLSYLAAWKEYLGYSVNVVTTSWINNSYPGADLQERIRNFLVDKYITWSINYVLLVGNIDLIPMRYCYADPNDHSPNSEFRSPTDYYYADLTGDWDSDNDGFFGEYGQDSVDFVPEVIVARIPWNTELNRICQKLVRFEQDTGVWKDNALLLGAIYFYQGESGYPRTDAAELMEEMKYDILGGWTHTTMYEMEGLRPCIYTCDLPLNESNVLSNWSSNAYGVVNWGGHGALNRVSRHLWSWDDGDSIPEELELQRVSFFGNWNVPFLNDDCPSINFCASCNNAWPEEENVARELIRNGSAGVAACTRPSYITLGWDDEDDGGLASTDYYFFHFLINQNEKIGDALFDAQVYYYNNFFWWGYMSQHNLFCLNLYGEPSLAREGYAVPLVSVHDYEWLDSGGDGFADPGDTISLTVALVNSGINASSVTLDIMSDDPLITMIDSNSYYGSILNGEIKDNATDPFIFCIADTAPCNACTLELRITVDSLDFYDNIAILIGTPPVLIVDDDGGATYETYFAGSLNRLNTSYHLLDSDELVPDSSIYRYDALIWLTGDNPSPIDSTGMVVLSGYLNNGGKLFITGQDIEGCQDADFFHDYLHASVIDSSVYRMRVDGVDGDPISNGLTYLIIGAPGANNQDSPTIISPLAGADSIFSYRLGGCCGVRYENSFKTVYLSYGFEAIAAPSLADTVMKRILEWFDISPGIEEIATWHDVPEMTLSLKVSPNPFSKLTSVNFSLGQSAERIELSIYDAAGRLVRDFSHAMPNAPCAMQISWSGDDNAGRKLACGVYFVRLTAGDCEETKKVLLVK